MWTGKHREIYKRVGGRYRSDLADAEWARLVPLIPPGKPGGRPRTTDMRAAMNAILSAAQRLPLALSATRRLPATPNRSHLLWLGAWLAGAATEAAYLSVSRRLGSVTVFFLSSLALALATSACICSIVEAI